MDTNKFALESLEKLYLHDKLADVKLLFEINESESESEFKFEQLPGYNKKDVSTKKMLNTFLHLKQSTLKKVLQFNETRCKETEIFDACMAWAKFACKRKGRDEIDANNLRLELGDCFDLIRFGVMHPEEFIKHTASYRDMFTRDEFKDILYKKSSQFTPNTFNHEPRLYLKGDFEYVRDKIDYTCPRESKEDKPELLDVEPYYVENTESVWFSSDQWIALTKIQFIPLGVSFFSKPKFKDFEFDIKVIEVNAKDFLMAENGKVCYAGIVKLDQNYTTILLPRAIYIDPECTYEIRLEIMNHPEANDHLACHCVAWNSEFECEDKFKILFHQNPKKSNYHGLVSELTVKRLQ